MYLHYYETKDVCYIPILTQTQLASLDNEMPNSAFEWSYKQAWPSKGHEKGPNNNFHPMLIITGYLLCHYHLYINPILITTYNKWQITNSWYLLHVHLNFFP